MRSLLLVGVVAASLLLLLHVSPMVRGECERFIVESMPDGLELEDPAGVLRTHVSLLDIVENAKKTLRIASFYWWLTAPQEFAGHPSIVPGQQLMEAVKQASARGVDVQVVLDQSGRRDMNNPDDIVELKKVATVKHLNMTRLLRAGVLHSKFIIADNETFYVGSSNFDWRSYTQIKEIGVTFKECPKLGEDLDKIFRTYMLMADSGTIPQQLTDDFATSINLKNPYVSGQDKLLLSGSPPAFNRGLSNESSTGRAEDIDALLHILNKARHRIDISVMNYSPRLEFGWPREYWPLIDDALRRAATERRVKVRLLFSKWSSSKPLESVWYRSLNAIQSNELRGGGIYVKLFEVPAFDDFQRSIPFARVKHDKYMVTDNGLYIGTSNWTPDYFINTCGVGVVFEPSTPAPKWTRNQRSNGSPTSPRPRTTTTTTETPTTYRPRPSSSSDMVRTMQAIFERDFNSQYAHELQ